MRATCRRALGQPGPPQPLTFIDKASSAPQPLTFIDRARPAQTLTSIGQTPCFYQPEQTP